MARTPIGERIRINCYFDAEILQAMRQIAALKNSTYSEMLRIAAREFVVREAHNAMASKTAIQTLQPSSTSVPAGTYGV